VILVATNNTYTKCSMNKQRGTRSRALIEEPVLSPHDEGLDSAGKTHSRQAEFVSTLVNKIRSDLPGEWNLIDQTQSFSSGVNP
jgi:hypothetical protein